MHTHHTNIVTSYENKKKGECKYENIQNKTSYRCKYQSKNFTVVFSRV